MPEKYFSRVWWKVYLFVLILLGIDSLYTTFTVTSNESNQIWLYPGLLLGLVSIYFFLERMYLSEIVRKWVWKIVLYLDILVAPLNIYIGIKLSLIDNTEPINWIVIVIAVLLTIAFASFYWYALYLHTHLSPK